MFYASAPRLSNVSRAVILGLSLSAATGWCTFAVSKQSSAEVERQLRDRVASLQEDGAQLLAERTKTQVSLSEVAQLRTELVAARGEIHRLSQSRDQVQTELPPVRIDVKRTASRSSAVSDDVSATGSVGKKTIRLSQDKAALSGTLSQLRNKQVAAVRIAAQGTQRAAEKLQHGKAPTIISELDTAALRQLTKSGEALVR